MTVYTLVPLLAQQPGAPDQRGAVVQLLGMIAIMGVMFYFALWRPQQKKAKEHAALVSALKPKDEIVTNSGIVGVIVNVKEKTVIVRSEETKLEILRTAVGEVLKRPGDTAKQENKA